MERISVINKQLADNVLEHIKKKYDEHGFVLVSDIYDVLAIRSTQTDKVFGWTDISDIRFIEHETCSDPLLDSHSFEFYAPPEVRLDNELLFSSIEPAHTDGVLRRSGRYPWGADKEDPMVSHPPHYQSPNGMEVIDVIENFTSDLNGIEATDTGNIIKYICRWKHKNGLQDLKKAQWYLNHLINHIEKTEKESN